MTIPWYPTEADFESVRNWVDSINAHAGLSAARVLVGNKIDLEEDRVVTKMQAEELAAQYGFSYFEVSAKANIGLADAMEHIFE